MIRSKKFLSIILVVVLITVFFSWKISSKDERLITILDNIIPLGNLEESVPIETNWNYDSDNWELTFEDDFEGEVGKVDTSKWEVLEYNRKNNDNGPDGYWKKDHVYKDGNGNLVIKFDRIENQNNDDDPHDYATGVIRSKNKFEQTYGKYEIRCKLPVKKGWWVAFWLMTDGVASTKNGGRDGAEIDIFEGFGWNDTIYHTVHWDGYGSKHKSAYNFIDLDDRDDFHTYTLIWTPTEYQYYVDGSLTWVTKGGGVSEVDEHLLVSGESTTVKGLASASWSESPENEELPDEFVVDYVKVYQYVEQEVALEEITSLAETTVETTEAVSETTVETTEAVSETTVETTEAVSETTVETTEAVAETTVETTEAVAETTVGTTEVVAETTDDVQNKALKIVNISNDREVYSLGDEIKWTVEAEGEDLRYMYYLSRDFRNIDSTKFLTSNQYTARADQPGIYTLVVSVIDSAGNYKEKQSKNITVVSNPLIFNDITYQKDDINNKVTWNMDATGDDVRFSVSIIENGSVIKKTPYRYDSVITHDIEKGKKYMILAFALDKYGNSQYKYSSEFTY